MGEKDQDVYGFPVGHEEGENGKKYTENLGAGGKGEEGKGHKNILYAWLDEEKGRQKKEPTRRGGELHGKPPGEKNATMNSTETTGVLQDTPEIKRRDKSSAPSEKPWERRGEEKGISLNNRRRAENLLASGSGG